MKLCPFCAEEIQDAAIRCKHCRSDLVEQPGPGPIGATFAPRSARPRRARHLVAVTVALAALVLALPVLGGPAVRHLRASRASAACEPSSWAEWHDALRAQCLEPSYVCEHLTTSQLLRDPQAAHSFGKIGSRVPEVVGRMRQAYGCSPEPGPAFHPEPGPVVPPAFPPRQDEPRSI